VKTIKPLIILILIIVIMTIFLLLGKSQQMTVVYEGNRNRDVIEMTSGKFQCSECGMFINDLNFASQVVAPDGKTWFFDDHGCMAAWISARPFKAEAIIWVKDLPSGAWIDGKAAWYSRRDQTPMSYGFGAYRTYGDGLIAFTVMQQAMLKGETMANLSFRKQLMEN
jgi:copper chaperone NosL